MEDISVLVFPLFYHEESREGKRAVFNLRDFRQIFPIKPKAPSGIASARGIILMFAFKPEAGCCHSWGTCRLRSTANRTCRRIWLRVRSAGLGAAGSEAVLP